MKILVIIALPLSLTDNTTNKQKSQKEKGVKIVQIINNVGFANY